MPNTPASITQLQQNNTSRDMSEVVQASGPSMDFQANNSNIVINRPKQDLVFEEVLPEVQRELIVKYDDNLTAISNYSYVHERDDAGNIIFKENASDNQLLTIEPVTYQFKTEFINKTINTRFSYFRFPAKSIATVNVPQLNSLDNNFNSSIVELRNYTQNATDEFTGANAFDTFDQTVQSITNPSLAADAATNAINSAPFNNSNQTAGNLMQSAIIGQG